MPKITRISKDKKHVHIEFNDKSTGFYILKEMYENIPDIANADEWNTPCPSNCGDNVVGIITYLGERYGFCNYCNSWYNLETGKRCSNPLDLGDDTNGE